jgi:PHP family Zn ribbon phosphoesterase
MAHFNADLHLHSRNGRGAIPRMSFPVLAQAATQKGLHLIGTGDCLQPERLQEIRAGLTPSGNGFYHIPGNNTQFLLTTEIAAPLLKEEPHQRVHLLLLVPQSNSAEKIAQALSPPLSFRQGVPIYGWPVQQLIQRVLNEEPETTLIPTHIFNPDNSLFSRSERREGQSLLLENLSPFFPAVETGLSADPFSCWKIRSLDHKTLVSFSNARTPVEVGREITFFAAEFSAKGLRQALIGEGGNRIAGTLEYWPELGGHFFNGHKECRIRRSPVETRLEGTSCPACHSPLTIGTMQRSQDLADRATGDLNLYQQNGWVHTRHLQHPPYRKVLPLREVIAASGLISNRDPRKAEVIYDQLTGHGITELEILLEALPQDLSAMAPPSLVEALQRVRENRFRIKPGYDGIPGQLTIFDSAESRPKGQLSLFH